MNADSRVLCVDAGNSVVKFAIAGATGWSDLPPVPTARVRVGLAASLQKHQRKLAAVDGVAVSSVVPSVDAVLAAGLRRATGQRPLFVGPDCRFPFRLAIARPERVGADRLCAAAGAVGRRGRRAVIVDVGSAVTVDLVARGEYRGGLIFAGPGLALWALGRRAEKLPPIDYGRVRDAFPRRMAGTRNAMILGAGISAVGAVKEAVRTLEKDVQGRAKKVVTGGGARALMPRLPRSWVYEPRLVLLGLRLIWLLNR